MAQLSKYRMTDEVVRLLRSRIVCGELSPGSRVDIPTVAAELGVSRTPVREAVLQLESAGLVTREPYRGAVVAGIDLGRLEEVTALRIDLEGLAARRGASRLTDPDLARMRAAHEALGVALDGAENAVERFNLLNREFHVIVYTAAAAPTLLRLIGILMDEADRMRLHFDMSLAAAQSHHEEILVACERRDGQAAREATRRHLLESYFGMRGDRAVPHGILADVLREERLEAVT